jgi:hypothetical protein
MTRVAVRVLALAFGGLALLEGLTLVVSFGLYGTVPVWLAAMWGVRTVGYGAAAVWLWRRERRGLWMGLVMLGTIAALMLPPFGDWILGQTSRRMWAVAIGAGLLAFGWTGTRPAPEGIR